MNNPKAAPAQAGDHDESLALPSPQEEDTVDGAASFATQEEAHERRSSQLRRRYVLDPSSPPVAAHSEETPSAADDNNNDDCSDASDRSSCSEDVTSSSDDDDDANGGLRLRRSLLLENRARNIKRNEEMLERLGLLHQTTSKKKKATLPKRKRAHGDSPEDEEEVPRRGMLLPVSGQDRSVTRNQRQSPASSGVALDSTTTARTTITLTDLESRFPFRDSQVNKLTALLESAAAQATWNPTFVPAPIIVHGPSGSGKTAVVKGSIDLVVAGNDGNATQQQATAIRKGPRVVDAYVDCSALDFPSIEEVTGAAYNIFARKLNTGAKHKRGRKRKHVHESRTTASGDGARTKQHFDSKAMKSSMQAQVLRTEHAAETGEGSDFKNLEEQVERARSSRISRRLRSGRPSRANTTKQPSSTDSSKNDNTLPPQQDLTTSSLTTVWKFGCALKSLLNDRRLCSVLVLDHAERLLPFAERLGSKDPINFLSQILLLPQLLELNLTVVLITKSALLGQTRLHIPPKKGTLAGCIQPIRIHFPSYRGKGMMKRILTQPHVQRLVFGEMDDINNNKGDDVRRKMFQQTLRQSFLETVVQSLHDSTCDVKEYISLGRSLWPTYIEPLGRAKISRTMETASKAALLAGGGGNDDSRPKANGNNIESSLPDPKALQREILSLLDRKFLPHLSSGRMETRGLTLAGGVGVAKAKPSAARRGVAVVVHDFPLLTKYLLLAAFLCQVNRPDRDRQLFSIQKSGGGSKRRRRSSGGGGTNQQPQPGGDAGEETAFGGGSSVMQQQLKSIRPRSFPVERMLSVFISMVSLHASAQLSGISGSGSNIDDDDWQSAVRSLGSCAFYENVAHLRDAGLLHDHPSRHYNTTAAAVIRMNDTQMSCSLTREEANGIARSLNFPMDRYLL